MRRLAPPVRMLLVIAWALVLVSTVVAQVLFVLNPDPTPVVVMLVLVNVPPSVAFVAMRWPGSMALFARSGAGVLLGLWTTSVLSFASGLVVGGVLSLIQWSPDPLVNALFVALVIACSSLVGLCLYLFVGEFLVGAFLVSTARLRGVTAPFDRLATGTLLLLVLVLAVAAALSIPDDLRLRGAGIIWFALLRFDGTPWELALSWIARAALVGIGACVLWILELRAKQGLAKRLRRRIHEAKRGA